MNVVCMSCKRKGEKSEHKHDPVIKCPECGNILARNYE